MNLPAGTSLGRYQIRSLLGAGAMGEVYLADDIQLNRPVALKLLHGELTRSREHLRRFEQEARIISALNHPNILTIHEVGRVESNHFIVTEFVDGLTLRQFIRRGRLGPKEATDIAAQVASGLIAAHKAGVVHRDIKPENIMLREDSYVKLLDFGLAKLNEGLLARRPPADESTLSNINSAPGAAVGTVSYMAPEQLRGGQVDARADIWSLGVVLYEMLAGRAPFEGASAADVIVAVLERDPPPLDGRSSNCPAELQRVVTKALQKSRERRYQTVGQMLDDLRQLGREMVTVSAPAADPLLLTGGASGNNGGGKTVGAFVAPAGESGSGVVPAAPGVGSRRGRVQLWPPLAGLSVFALAWALSGSWWVAALAGVVAAAAASLLRLSPRLTRFRLTRREPFRTFKLARLTETGKATNAVISPDGRYVAYASEHMGLQSLWVRQVATASNIQIVPPADVTYQGITFSPDCDYVYYVFFDNTRKNLWLVYQVPTLGGVPKRLLTEAHTPVTFSPDGARIAFIRGYPTEKVTVLMTADAAGGGGEQTLAARSVPVEYGWRGGPAWSPDGRVVVTAVGTYDVDMGLIGVDVRDGTERPLTSQRWPWVGRAAWLRDGRGLVFTARDPASGLSQIWYISYPGGKVRRITNDLNDYHWRSLSLSADSRLLVSVQTTYLSSIWLVAEGDASRARQVSPGRSDGYYGLCWTPDGRLVYTSRASGSQDIWVMDGDGGNQKQLTFGTGSNYHPSASPDGRYVVFISTRTGEPNIWRVDINGDNPRQLTDGGNPSWPQCSPDGHWVVYKSQRAGKKVLWKVSIDGGEPVQVTDRFTSVPSVSPDGRLVACEYWDEHLTSKTDVAVVPLEGGPPVRVFDVPTTFARSVHLSGVLRWTADGQQVSYVDNRGGVSNIWGQPLDGGPPRQVTDFGADQIFWFDWSKDGRVLACARGIAISDIVLISDPADEGPPSRRSLH